MQYLYNNTVSNTNFAPYIEEINAMEFENHQDVINDEIFIVTLADARARLINRFNPVINNTSGHTQSLRLGERDIYLIIINEDLCVNMDISAVILHEMGHIVNEFGTEITTLQAWKEKILDSVDRNKEIKLRNEFGADFFAKKCGYAENIIQNLRNSLRQNYDDEELNSRILALESDEIFDFNNLRAHRY
ncbi:hypothetical protein [Flavobacterium gyeonganense]|uniref:Uncharacterized protein n=1 Tax=Flavobacterium gyeonganense TaxID=1310418 RepID=A0ABV5HA43_9FLAO|nr:hypothetical protein [Flavobacterium gyeonganense]